MMLCIVTQLVTRRHACIGADKIMPSAFCACLAIHYTSMLKHFPYILASIILSIGKDERKLPVQSQKY